MFEPVPSFFEELTGHWKGYKAELGFDATLYNFGLGSNDRCSGLGLALFLEYSLFSGLFTWHPRILVLMEGSEHLEWWTIRRTRKSLSKLERGLLYSGNQERNEFL